MKNNVNIEQYINYRNPFLTKTKIFLICMFTFFIAFILYFPLMLKIEDSVKKALGSIPGCNIKYEKMDTEFFWLPKVTVKKVNIPASCLSGTKDLILDEIALNFRFFAFDPFGLHFLMNIKALDTKIDGNLTVGIFEHAVNINRNTIELETLAPYLGSAPTMKGKVELNILSKFNNNQLINLLLNVNSSNLILPPQRVQILDLPLMDIKNLLIKLKSLPEGKINVEKFIIGDENSPIRANFSGNIKPNLRAFSLSSLDIDGEVSFSESFLSDFSLIKGLMAAYPIKDNFYQIRLKGSLGNIRPMPLK